MGKEQSTAQWLWETWQGHLASRTLSDEEVAGWIGDLLEKKPEELDAYSKENWPYRATIGNRRVHFFHHSVPDDKTESEHSRAKPDFEVFVSPPWPNAVLADGHAFLFTYFTDSKRPSGFLRFYPPTEEDKDNGFFEFQKEIGGNPIRDLDQIKQIPEVQRLVETVKQGTENGIVGLVHYNQTGKSG